MRQLSSALLTLFTFACSTPQQIARAVKPVESPATPTFRVAFGSCNNQDLDQSFWLKILQKTPQVWLWLGDNIYGDTRVPRILEAKYKKMLNTPEYQALMAQVRVTGTWDDHDFGENDAGGKFPMKRKSKELFWDFMQVPRGSALRMQEGVYRAEEWSVGARKVKLIILDTRYMRDPLQQNTYHEYITTDGDILGAEQWEWFERELGDAKDFDAVVIANGTQVIGDQHRFEKWANFPKSRDKLYRLLSESPVKIKVLLSGDRHFGEIAQIALASGAKLTEVVSSGLTHTYEKVDEPNPARIGKLWNLPHYALMDFYDEPAGLRVKFSLEDIATQSSVATLEVKGE